MLRESQAMLRKGMRELDREREKLQREEKKLQIEIKQMAKKGKPQTLRNTRLPCQLFFFFFSSP